MPVLLSYCMLQYHLQFLFQCFLSILHFKYWHLNCLVSYIVLSKFVCLQAAYEQAKEITLSKARNYIDECLFKLHSSEDLPYEKELLQTCMILLSYVQKDEILKQNAIHDIEQVWHIVYILPRVNNVKTRECSRWSPEASFCKTNKLTSNFTNTIPDTRMIHC